MKRLILLGIFLFTVSFSHAANKMSMVTYFPVPYVAYSQVSVDQQLDVGLTSTCTMNLGCRESGTNLNANVVNLKSGKLELNQGKGVVGDKILLGSGSGNGQIQFSNVRIQGGTIQSVNAGNMNVKSLQLFNKPFPPCKGKGGSDGQMSWKQLKLKGYSGTDANGELYLVCGDVSTSEESCQGPTRGNSYREPCLDSAGNQYDIRIFTWNEEKCAYEEHKACSGGKYCRTNESYIGGWKRLVAAGYASSNSKSCGNINSIWVSNEEWHNLPNKSGYLAVDAYYPGSDAYNTLKERLTKNNFISSSCELGMECSGCTPQYAGKFQYYPSFVRVMQCTEYNSNSYKYDLYEYYLFAYSKCEYLTNCNTASNPLRWSQAIKF